MGYGLSKPCPSDMNRPKSTMVGLNLAFAARHIISLAAFFHPLKNSAQAHIYCTHGSDAADPELHRARAAAVSLAPVSEGNMALYASNAIAQGAPSLESLVTSVTKASGSPVPSFCKVPRAWSGMKSGTPKRRRALRKVSCSPLVLNGRRTLDERRVGIVTVPESGFA